MRPRKTARIRSIWAGIFAAALLVGAGVIAVQSDGSASNPPRGTALKSVQLVPSLSLSAGGQATRSLPRSPWAVSFDVRLPADSELYVGGGSGPGLVIRRGRGGAPELVGAHKTFPLTPHRGWPTGGARHIEITSAPARLSIDGRSLPNSIGQGRQLTLLVRRGRGQVNALIISPSADRAAFLLHRLAELHARTAPARFPIGSDARDQIHFDRNWMIGFWAGALWQAAALEPVGGMFAGWALQATMVGFNPSGPASHDLGFQYGQSWQAAWQALCQGRKSKPAVCPRLRRTTLHAADRLRALAATNPGSGTIPVDAHRRDGVTIIDSMMNLDILTWASRVSGDPAYDRLASHHAHTVASVLVRPNGSTAQAVNYDRSTGQVRSIVTHQGLSDSSTWSRGQAWAVYGFAQTAASLHDRGLLAVAQRVADYVAKRLPSGGVPPWDYDAPRGAPVDVSAGVITAAGLFRLAVACAQMPGVCVHAERWVPLARRLLARSMQRARDKPPLGFLGPQLLNERNPGCWCNHGELTFGLAYALEGVRRQGA